MKFLEFILGTSEWALRLQSVIAHVFYLVFTFLLVKKLPHKILAVCGYVLLNVNPFLLDFFSLARGYAMAISFMIISIYYFPGYLKDQSQKKLIISLAAACLAVLANFTLLNYLLALVIFYVICMAYKYYLLKYPCRKILNEGKIILLVLVLMLAICYEPIRILVKNKQFYFGGDFGFWDDTTGSLIHKSLYGQPYEGKVFPVIQMIAEIATVGLPLVVLYQLSRRRPGAINIEALLFISLLLLIVASCCIQHSVLGTKFLLERCALFIIPIFMFLLIYLFDALFSIGRTWQTVGTAVIIILASAAVFHFCRSCNLSYTYDWRFDADDPNMLADLGSEAGVAGNRKIRLGISRLNEPSLIFYRTTKKLSWLQEVDHSGIDGNFDFYYLPADAILNNGLVEILKEYKTAHSYLLKKAGVGQ